MERQEIVKEYLVRFPDTPDRTIANKIYKENSLLFANLEAARASVRNIRGHSGDRKRKKIASKELFSPITGITNPFKFPESYGKGPEVYTWPLESNRVGIISDLHVPYHDIPALTATLNFLKKDFKANSILINGDLIDFHQISRWEKDPYKRSTFQEFEAAREILTLIRKNFPKAHIVYLKGNHCVRWEKYLLAKAPELFDDPDFTLKARLRTDALNIEILHDCTTITMSGLRVMHGHTVTRSMIPAVNAARGLFLKAKQSALIGHVHKVSEHNETNIDGKLTTTWSTGCLCELNPAYNPHGNNYSHGFATCAIEDEKNFSVKNYRIKDGKIL